MQEMSKFHVNATPTFFINGKHVGGALPKDGFKQIIDEQLKIAEASGVLGRGLLRQGRARQGREAVPLEDGSEAELIDRSIGDVPVPSSLDQCLAMCVISTAGRHGRRR